MTILFPVVRSTLCAIAVLGFAALTHRAGRRAGAEQKSPS